jgi:hypothetical protein
MSLSNHEIIKAVSGGVAAGAIGHYLSYGTEINSEYLKYTLMFTAIVLFRIENYNSAGGSHW